MTVHQNVAFPGQNFKIFWGEALGRSYALPRASPQNILKFCPGKATFWCTVIHIQNKCRSVRLLQLTNSPQKETRHIPPIAITVKKNYEKLAPYGTDGRLLLTANFKVT